MNVRAREDVTSCVDELPPRGGPPQEWSRVREGAGRGGAASGWPVTFPLRTLSEGLLGEQLADTGGPCECTQARSVVERRGCDRDKPGTTWEHRLLMRLEARGAAVVEAACPWGEVYRRAAVPVPARGHAPPPVGLPRPRQVSAAEGAPLLWCAAGGPSLL